MMRKTMISVIALALVALMFSSCGYFVDDSRACRAAETMGMSDCHVLERHVLTHVWNGCSRDDSVGFDVSARNAAGQDANLTVCCRSWPMHGCTVRAREE